MIVYIVEGYVPQQDDGSEQACVTIGVYDDSYPAEEGRRIAEENGYQWVTMFSLELNRTYVTKQ